MAEIAIVGAGELGGAIAHTLAVKNVASVIRLIDDRGRIAEGKALDIMQAAPIERFSTRLRGSTSVSDAGGAALVVIADRAAGGEWQGEDGLQLVARAAQFAPAAVLLCAGSSQRELVDQAVSELHVDRRRIFGSAPEALTAAARALVALAVDGSPKDVALSVVGLPPAQFVVPWEDVTVGGFRATRLISEPTRRQLARKIAAAWPPGVYALAAAAGKTIDAMFGRTRTVVSCFVGPETGGRRTRTAAMPVRLASDGIAGVVLPSLDVVDRVALENAILY
jgi:malate dehydrogenase